MKLPDSRQFDQPPVPEEIKRYLNSMDETIAEMKRRKKAEREAAHARQSLNQ